MRGIYDWIEIISTKNNSDNKTIIKKSYHKFSSISFPNPPFPSEKRQILIGMIPSLTFTWEIICQWSMGFLSPPDPLSHLTPDKSSHQYYRRNSLCHVNVAFWKMWSHCPLDPYNKIQLWNAMATCWPLTAPYRMTASNFCLMALNLSWSVLSIAECNN